MLIFVSGIRHRRDPELRRPQNTTASSSLRAVIPQRTTRDLSATMASWWADEVDTIPKPTPMIGYKWGEGISCCDEVVSWVLALQFGLCQILTGFVAPFQGSGRAAIEWALDSVMSILRPPSHVSLDPSKAVKCVDIGCGDGRVAIAAANRGMHVTGIDIDDSLLRIATEAALEYGLLL